MQKQLEVIRSFQKSIPLCHVGGSIGLFLLGFSLNRSIVNSDVDLVISAPIEFDSFLYDTYSLSDNSDFDIALRDRGIKVEICIKPELSFKTVCFEGIDYRVTCLEHILHYKRLYSSRGVEKHIHDLRSIFSQIGATNIQSFS